MGGRTTVLRWGSVWEKWGRMKGEVLWFDFGYLYPCIICVSDWLLETYVEHILSNPKKDFN